MLRFVASIWVRDFHWAETGARSVRWTGADPGVGHSKNLRVVRPEPEEVSRIGNPRFGIVVLAGGVFVFFAPLPDYTERVLTGIESLLWRFCNRD